MSMGKYYFSPYCVQDKILLFSFIVDIYKFLFIYTLNMESKKMNYHEYLHQCINPGTWPTLFFNFASTVYLYFDIYRKKPYKRLTT